MSDHQPRPPPGVIERAVELTRSLSLTNVLIIALIVLIALPAYFAYRFIADTDFRREFMDTAIILERHVPCVVLEGHKWGANKRHSVLVVYGLDGRNEKLVGMRSAEPMDFDQINEMCKKVAVMAAELKDK
jgi:hypothetical protein